MMAKRAKALLIVGLFLAASQEAVHATGSFGPAEALPGMGARCSGQVLPQPSVGPTVAFGVCDETDSTGTTRRDRLAFYLHDNSGWHGRQLTTIGVPWAAAQDATGSYVLYEARGKRQGASLLKRDTVGRYTTQFLGPVGPMSGAGLAARDGKWWAVWTGAAGGGNRFALYEAGTLFGATAAHRITSDTDTDVYPSLVIRPGGGLVLIWTRVRETTDGATQDIRIATRTGSAWASRSLATFAAPQTPAPSGLATDGRSVYASWVQDARPVVASNESGTMVSHRFVTRSCATRSAVAASGGRLTASVTQCASGDSTMGNATGGEVLILERQTGTWSSSNLASTTTGTGPVALAVTSSGGRATVLIMQGLASATRSE